MKAVTCAGVEMLPTYQSPTKGCPLDIEMNIPYSPKDGPGKRPTQAWNQTCHNTRDPEYLEYGVV